MNTKQLILLSNLFLITGGFVAIVGLATGTDVVTLVGAVILGIALGLSFVNMQARGRRRRAAEKASGKAGAPDGVAKALAASKAERSKPKGRRTSDQRIFEARHEQQAAAAEVAALKAAREAPRPGEDPE